MSILRSFYVWLVIIGIIIIVFPISFVVWLILYPFDTERASVHWSLTYQCYLMALLIPIWKIKIEGREKAEKNTPYVILSNHQSLLDVLILFNLRLRWKWISKIENRMVPFLAWYMRMAKYIYVDRGNKESKAEMMEKCCENLRNGISIMMFPEGTRSKDTEIAQFKLGAFQLAMMTDKSILPVVIDGTGGILPKHGLIFSPHNKLRMRVLDPVHPGSFGTSDPEALASRFRNMMAEELQKIREEK